MKVIAYGQKDHGMGLMTGMLCAPWDGSQQHFKMLINTIVGSRGKVAKGACDKTCEQAEDARNLKLSEEELAMFLQAYATMEDST